MAPRYSDGETAMVLSKLGIKPAPKNKDGGILNMVQAKRYCGVSDSTLMRLIKR
jgi:hypothetical protein